MSYRSLLFSMVTIVLFPTIFCVFYPGLSQAASLELKIQDDRVVIKAEDIELREILQAISTETGMQISYFVTDTSELISCGIDEATLAGSLSSLLKNWNYSLVFAESRVRPGIPESLLLVGRVANTPHSANISSLAENAGNPNDHMQHVAKREFADLFTGEGIQARQLEVQQEDVSSGQADGSSAPFAEQRGIQITSISPGSAFAKIGLHAGDRIYDVNGAKVNSAKDLVTAMKNPGNHSTIRIERYTNDRNIDPIYIELH